MLAFQITGEVASGFAAALVAATAVFAGLYRVLRARLAAREEAVLAAARTRSGEIETEARRASESRQAADRQAFERELERPRRELAEREARLRKKEDALDAKLETFSKKERFLERTERSISEAKAKIEIDRVEIERVLEEEKRTLHAVSGMSREQAAEALFSRLEKELEKEAAERIRKVAASAEQESASKAREILTLAIQRCAAAHTAAVVVTTVDLPSDELKGRIIGREGRNIRAFEKATGADVIVDDTPGVVVVSSFDGVRRFVAKRTMEKLIADGRIHPGRIEEVAAETRKEVDREINEIGKKASFDAGVHGLHPKEVALLGRLYFVTSEGSNVLSHSVEVADLAGTLAGELGFDVQLAKRIGLLHDIGRAADHDMEGSHSAAGADIARRYEERREVVNAIAAHHGEEPPETMYAVIVQAANRVSHERPGSARDGVERFLKRLARLEEIATSFSGIKTAYAVQAGREVRVTVDPGQVPDSLTPKLCRDIAKAIQAQANYPGEVQVTVLREVRVRGFAKKI